MKIEGQSSGGKPAHPIKESKPPGGEKKTIGQVFEKSVDEKEKPQNCTIWGHIEAGMANAAEKSMEETAVSIGLDAISRHDPAMNPLGYFMKGYGSHVVDCTVKRIKENDQRQGK